jgi:hypothetical protein
MDQRFIEVHFSKSCPVRRNLSTDWKLLDLHTMELLSHNKKAIFNLQTRHLDFTLLIELTVVVRRRRGFHFPIIIRDEKPFFNASISFPKMVGLAILDTRLARISLTSFTLTVFDIAIRFF